MSEGALISPYLPAKRDAKASALGRLPSLRALSGRRLWDANSSLMGQPLGDIGNLEVRLAHKASEVRRAQRLRYRVFYKEGAAIAEPTQVLAQRDFDSFDLICDHLLVVDRAGEDGRQRRKAAVVGTYRLLRQEIAERHGGFYTASEFDIDPLIAAHPTLRFLELGRSCVLSPYRNKRTVELLWQGIYGYLRHHQLDVMIGCASLEGTDPDRLALPLSFLHHFAPAPEAWRGRARDDCYVPMNRMPKEAIDQKAALHALPPLIKGYLRLGAYIGEGAVVDHQFGTTDVLIVLPVSAIRARYLQYFSDGGAAAAA